MRIIYLSATAIIGVTFHGCGSEKPVEDDLSGYFANPNTNTVPRSLMVENVLSTQAQGVSQSAGVDSRRQGGSKKKKSDKADEPEKIDKNNIGITTLHNHGSSGLTLEAGASMPAPNLVGNLEDEGDSDDNDISDDLRAAGDSAILPAAPPYADSHKVSKENENNKNVGNSADTSETKEANEGGTCEHSVKSWLKSVEKGLPLTKMYDRGLEQMIEAVAMARFHDNEIPSECKEKFKNYLQQKINNAIGGDTHRNTNRMNVAMDSQEKEVLAALCVNAAARMVGDKDGENLLRELPMDEYLKAIEKSNEAQQKCVIDLKFRSMGDLKTLKHKEDEVLKEKVKEIQKAANKLLNCLIIAESEKRSKKKSLFA